MMESDTGADGRETVSVGAIVRARRGDLGLTLKEVAALAGVNKDTLSDLENDVRWPWPRTLASIARVLGLDSAELQQIKARQPA